MRSLAAPSNDRRADYTGTELDVLAAAANYHRWIVDKLRPYLGETVAEVGAGIGSVSRLLLDSPINRLIAFEPSANLFPMLSEELRHESRAVLINDFLNPHYLAEGVDSVVYLNVLEHAADDHAELANAFSVLRPGGHLLVFTPALPWLFSDFDRHVGHYRRYTKRGLGELASSVGFNLAKPRYFDVAGIIPWYVNFVLLKGRPTRRGVALYDKLIVPPMRLVEKAVPPPIGKNLLLIARKP
jgi:SAM-dependent methyltransferase